MTLFDVLVGLLLIVSGLVGFVRGATREVTTVIALVLAAVAAVAGLRFAGPIARHFVATPWLATSAALLVVFLVVYIALRLLAGRLTHGVRHTVLSGLDRGLGFAIGVVRGLVVVGVAVLLMTAATPPERMPAWMTKATLYPLAEAVGAGLRAFAPQGLKVAHDVADGAQSAVTEADSATAGPDAPARAKAPPHDRGYTESQRRALDELVEKSR